MLGRLVVLARAGATTQTTLSLSHCYFGLTCSLTSQANGSLEQLAGSRAKMALDLIDGLFYFWFLLGGLVYVIGETYEKQLRAKLGLSGPTAATKKLQERESIPQATQVSASWQNQANSRRDLEEPRTDATAQTQAYLPLVDQWSQVDELLVPVSQPRSSLLTPTIPTASGFSPDCVDWVNSIFYLFYSQPDKYGPIIRESINRSLNEKLSNLASQSSELSDFMIEFSSPLGPSSELTQCLPELTNVRTESESDKSVSATCKIYHKLIVFDLVIRKFRSHLKPSVNTNNVEQQYELVLENLEGKLKSIAMLGEKLIVVQFTEKPDTKILLRPGRQLQGRSSLPLVNEDRLVALILQTISNVVVDLYFGDDPEFPQFVQSSPGTLKNKLGFLRGSASELKRQIKHDFLGALTHASSRESAKERKVLVKVLNAKNINYNQTVVCKLELDSPHQLALSSTKQGSNPLWDEHFLFGANDKSDCLTISLWDADQRWTRREPTHGSQANAEWAKDFSFQNGKFLGQARVSMESLRKLPVQRLNLALEPQSQSTDLMHRADLSNSVGGEISLELLFLEHSVGPENSAGTLGKSASSSSISAQQGDVVSVERKLTPSGYLITTTTITKPKSKVQSAHLDPLGAGRNPSPISSAQSELDLEQTNALAYSNAESPLPSDLVGGAEGQAASGERPESGRSRSRSRSLLRAIKKRFSFSRTRSRSVSAALDGGAHLGQTNQQTSRAPSRASSELSSSMGGARARSVPPAGCNQAGQAEVPTIVINKSRLSDATSALSFAQPRSQLVFECQETNLDGKTVTRHFAVNESAGASDSWAPTSPKSANSLTNKLRKRGSTTKLHLFNEHQFVATHLAGSATCHLCGRVFSRRPGKQGYKCRNCHLLSHKQCHVKVDHQCPYAKRDLQLEFIDAEPPAGLLRERRANSSSSLRRSDNWSRAERLANAKSVSMEVEDN